MKKSKVLILVIILLAIFGIVFYLYQVDINKKQLEKELQTAEEMWKLQAENAELKDKITNQTSNQNEAKETQKSNDVEFDSSKMKSDSSFVNYEVAEMYATSDGLEIEIKDGKPFLTTNIEDKNYKFLFSELTEPVKNKEITGFNQEVKEVYYAHMGNGDPYPIILFLMKDGSVEFADSLKVLKNEEFNSAGKIKELSNIVKFVHLDAEEISEDGERMGGWMTVAAIDEDGYSFDLSLSETIRDYNKIDV